jgi:hypothetical protein
MSVQNKKISVKNTEINLIVLGSVFITLSLTPWVNADSLIIPKQIILFCLAFFLIPKLVINIRPFMKFKLFKISILISILIAIIFYILSSKLTDSQDKETSASSTVTNIGRLLNALVLIWFIIGFFVTCEKPFNLDVLF